DNPVIREEVDRFLADRAASAPDVRRFTLPVARREREEGRRRAAAHVGRNVEGVVGGYAVGSRSERQTGSPVSGCVTTSIAAKKRSVIIASRSISFRSNRPKFAEIS